MTDAETDREIMAYRSSLVDLAARAAAEGSALYEDVRSDADALTCLLEEAPERKQAKIRYLLDRYDALIASLVN